MIKGKHIIIPKDIFSIIKKKHKNFEKKYGKINRAKWIKRFASPVLIPQLKKLKINIRGLNGKTKKSK